MNSVKPWVSLTNLLIEAVNHFGMCYVSDTTFYLYCYCVQHGLEVRDGRNTIQWVLKQDKYGDWHVSCRNLRAIANKGLLVTRRSKCWMLTPLGLTRAASYRKKYGPVKRRIVKWLSDWLYGDLDPMLAIARMCDSLDEEVDRRTENALAQLGSMPEIRHGTVVTDEMIHTLKFGFQ